MSYRSTLFFILLTSITLSIGGCIGQSQFTQKSTDPTVEYATVFTDSRLLGFVSVDGKRLGSTWSGKRHRIVYLAPGEHVLGLRYDGATKYANFNHKVIVTAGSTYFITYRTFKRLGFTRIQTELRALQTAESIDRWREAVRKEGEHDFRWSYTKK